MATGRITTCAPMTPVLHVPTTNAIVPRPSYLEALAVPEDLGPRILNVVANPRIWWVGQFVNYVMRYQPEVRKMLNDKLVKNNITSGPIVGIHVRRTDKQIEAPYHILDE